MFARFPDGYVLSNIVPITWNALVSVGPAFMTQMRNGSLGRTSSGVALYWLATPLNTTYSGSTASIRSMSPSYTPLIGLAPG